MSEKNKAKTKNRKALFATVIAICVVLLGVAAVLIIYFTGKNTEPKPVALDDNIKSTVFSKFGIDISEYEYLNFSDDGKVCWVKFNIGALSPKRFMAKLAQNDSFYSLYENGFGYQYNRETGVNKKDGFSSSLHVKGCEVGSAFWTLRDDGTKIYCYFVDNSDGSFTVFAADKQL